MNKNSEAVSNHTQEIANMKQKLEDQSLKIKSLEKKVTSKEKADKLSILKITGLKKSETEAIHTLLQLAKEKLEVWIGLDLFNDDTRPSGHISRPTQVNVSWYCFHSLDNYSSLIILRASWS